MTFDQTMFVWCVIVPGSIAAAAIGLTPRVPARFRGLAVAVGWWCAVVAAMVGLHGWQWWPDEFWRQSIWPILAWAVCFSGAALQQSDADSWRSDTESLVSGRWVLAGTLACVTAVVAIPSGEPWSDTFHLHRIWVAAVATSCLLNSFSIDCMSRSGAARRARASAPLTRAQAKLVNRHCGKTLLADQCEGGVQ